MKFREKRDNKKLKRISLIVLIVLVVLAVIIKIITAVNKSKENYTVEKISSSDMNYYRIISNGKSGVIDKNGNVIIKPEYNTIKIPNPKDPIFVCIYDYNATTGDYKTKVLNDQGQEILTNYEDVNTIEIKEIVSSIPYEKTVLQYQKDGKYGIIDFNGKEITKPEESSLEYTNKNRIKVKPGFNYSAVINFGVKCSSGEYVIQLNNDTELITENWLEILLGFIQRKDVGAVGVKLYFPDETIQHAGIIVGIGGIAGNRFKSIPKNGHGYFAQESMIENLSAVTGACLMAPKAIYEEVGWMDENLAVAFNDVDFCLKIREKGYLVVYNPYVEFWHYESKTRGAENTPAKIKRFQGEISRFEQKWGNILDEGDPYYNINLSLDTEVYHMKNIKVNYGDIPIKRKNRGD